MTRTVRPFIQWARVRGVSGDVEVRARRPGDPVFCNSDQVRWRRPPLRRGAASGLTGCAPHLGGHPRVSSGPRAGRRSSIPGASRAGLHARGITTVMHDGACVLW